eukprot:scaffold10267_cov116-Isochrysis_galbana.AAC.13
MLWPPDDGQTKVDKLDALLCAIENEVFEFEVAMAYALRVAVVDRFHHLKEERLGTLFADAFQSADQLLHVAAGRVLHHHVYCARRLNDFE